MKQQKKRIFGILLTLVMVLGLMSGMGLTVLATEPEIITVTWKNTDFTGQTHTKDGVTINSPGVVYNKGSEIEVGKYGNDWTFTTTLGSFTRIEVTGGWTNTFPGGKAGWSGKTWTGNSSSVSAYGVVTDANGYQPWTITFTIKNVPVTGVTLNPSAAQSINVGGSVAFTATVAPDGATDKTVKWSTTGGVTLYSDENCTAGNEIGADATSTLTVYAKGTAAGSATVTATSNADSTKSASCNVTVGKADQTAPTGLTATKASSNSAADGKISGVTSAMEYQIDGASAWTAVGENKTEITDLAAGTYRVRYAGTADKNASPAATVEVGVKVAPTVTAPTAKTLTYNGQAQELVIAGSTEDGTLYYSVTTENTAPTDDSLYTTSIPTATDAGTYYVWYKVVGDDNHNDSEPACVTVKISEKSAPTPSKVSGTEMAKMTAKGNTGMTIAWNKIQGAAGYDIFFARCGKNIPCKKVKTIKGNKTFKWTKTGLKKGTSYKAYVKAYVIKNGKKEYVRTSPMLHAYGGNVSGNHTNAKSISVNKTKVSLKKGKTFTIKAKVAKVKSNKKLMPKSHVATLKYLTSNSKVATVSKSGKITAKGKGSCVVYAYAHNGISKAIKVTVK